MACYKTSILLNILSLTCLLKFKFADCTLFNAGVVEYYYPRQTDLKPKQLLLNNANKYFNITGEFRKNWNPHVTKGILVFPECGLTPEFTSSENHVIVPEPNEVNYNFTGNEVIAILSSAARTYSTWVVVNLIEANGTKSYNTDVVFRSDGTIAAKYRKYNLYGEPVDKPSLEVVSFKTDFGVTFGIFTCFDILYQHPAEDLLNKGIKHFIYPTAWYSELPFLTAIQYQMSWSRAHNAILLASGLNNVKVGHTGSGIYNGREGPIKYYQATQTKGSHLIMATLNASEPVYTPISTTLVKVPHDLPTDDTTIDKEKSGQAENISRNEVKINSAESQLTLKKEPIDIYTTQTISPIGCKVSGNITAGDISICSLNMSASLCNHDLCCDFNLTAEFSVYICIDEQCTDVVKHKPNQYAPDDFSLSVHRLAVFDGVRSFDVATAGVQTCSIISCTDDNISSCGKPPVITDPVCFNLEDKYPVCVLRRYIPKVSIVGKFSLNNTFIAPNILLGRKELGVDQFGNLTNEFTFNGNSNGLYTLIYKDMKQKTPLGTIAIWSRVYDRDGQSVTSQSTNLKAAVLTFILIIALNIYTARKFISNYSIM